MGIGSISRCHFWLSLQLILVLLQLQSYVFCYQYKVGDLNGWNIPSSVNPNLYLQWSYNHTFRIGDSLFFLYPPSQDSVILVTEQSYQSCNIKDPIFLMKDGNSVFNITCPGDFYFTSGVGGHCENQQKLHIFVAGNGPSCSFPPPISSAAAAAPSPLPVLLSRSGGGSPSPAPAPAPAAPSPFSNIPLQETSSSALLIHASPVSILLATICLFIYG